MGGQRHSRVRQSFVGMAAALAMATGLLGSLSAMELQMHSANSASRMVAEGNEFLIQGQYERAIASYQRALEADNRDFNALFNLGLAWQAQKHWDQARRRFEEALLLRPEHPATISNLGIIAFSIGEYHEAAARFATAAQVAAGNPTEAADYLYNVGTAREALGQWSEARDAYRAASELDPDHFDALYNLGTLHMGQALRHAASAERYLRLAQRVSPDRSEAMLNLAILFESQNRLDDAQQHYDLAVNTARERQPAMLNNTLWRRALFNDTKVPPDRVAMRRDLEELLRRDPNYPGANGMLARHYRALGELDQAIDLFEREVSADNFDPEDAHDIDAVYQLARIYNEDRPNARRAMEYASRFYRLRPDSPRERELRRRLRNMNLTGTGSTNASTETRGE